jgi:antitoxin ParD1/3/4
METEQPITEQLNDVAFEAAVEQLMNELAQDADSNVPTLSDYAVSRASIYEDHS